MGKVYANVTIENAFDRERTRSALIPEAAVRHVHYKAMLADSGATTLCLPAEAIAELGLPFLDEVRVGTATGVVPARLFEGARIRSMAGRGRLSVSSFPEGASRCLASSRWRSWGSTST